MEEVSISSRNQLEKKEKITSVIKSLTLAIQRTGSKELLSDDMIKDIVNEFDYVEEKHLIKAIRNGSLGVYGRTFKMCTQEVCLWVRAYIKSNPELETDEMRLIRLRKEQ